MSNKLTAAEMGRMSIDQYRQADKLPLVVILDNVRSQHNVGAVFRTADAMRIERVILCGICCCPPNQEIHKTALGAEESVEWLYFKDTKEAVKALQAEGYTVYAVEQAHNSITLEEAAGKVQRGNVPCTKVFSERFEADGIHFIEPSEHLFDFNNPVGACPECKGVGTVMGIDIDLVVPDKSKSIYEQAIACWQSEQMRPWLDALIYNASKFGFPIHTPFYALTPEQKQLIWTGNEYFRGLHAFFHELEEKQYSKIQYRVMLARFKGRRAPSATDSICGVKPDMC